MEYLASAVIVALSKPCDGLSTKTNIFLFQPLICTDELLSTPKIMTFFPSLPFVYENRDRESNPIL